MFHTFPTLPPSMAVVCRECMDQQDAYRGYAVRLQDVIGRVESGTETEITSGRLQGRRRYDYMDVIGIVESGAETERMSGTHSRTSNLAPNPHMKLKLFMQFNFFL